MVGSAVATPFPMIGSVVNGQFVPDRTVYNISGDDILGGRIVCASPPGQGRNVSISVRHTGADDSSTPVFMDFLPPSLVAFVDASFAQSQSVTGVVVDQVCFVFAAVGRCGPSWQLALLVVPSRSVLLMSLWALS